VRHIIHLVIAIVILGAGFIAFNTLKGCEEKLIGEKSDTADSSKGGWGMGRPRTMPKIKTRVMELKMQDYTVQIHSQGEVRAHHTTSLTPQVGGRVMHISPGFEDGAFFKKGDILIELETADYLTEIESAKAAVARAKAAYAQEQARAKQALLNWKDAGFHEQPSDLVLRKPQLREAEANVASAQSTLERAERNLFRTKVQAPYNGRVRVRNVGLGQQVGPGTTLGEIFTTDVAEVRLPLTPRDLLFYQPPNKPRQIPHPDFSDGPNNITFTSIVSTDAQENMWKGIVTRTEGELDADSRQIFIIAQIDDPFGLKSKQTPLFIGQPVRATIPATKLKQVYIIPRDALSDLNEIIVIREGKILHINIKPEWSTSKNIIIRDGILAGDLLATTRMPYAPEGAPVEIIPDKEETAETANKAQLGAPPRISKKRPHKRASK